LDLGSSVYCNGKRVVALEFGVGRPQDFSEWDEGRKLAIVENLV